MRSERRPPAASVNMGALDLPRLPVPRLPLLGPCCSILFPDSPSVNQPCITGHSHQPRRCSQHKLSLPVATKQATATTVSYHIETPNAGP